MGLFDKPVVTCGVCGREVGKKEKRWDTKDGHLCPDCQKPFGVLSGPRAFSKYTNDQMKVNVASRITYNHFLDENKTKIDSFTITRNIADRLIIDDIKEQWFFKPLPTTEYVFHLVENEKYAIVYNFSDISKVFISQGSTTITSVSSTRKDKGIRSALLGGIIAGGAGAITGSILAQNKTTTQSIQATNYIISVMIDGLREPLSTSVDNEYSAKLILQMFSDMISDQVAGEDDGYYSRDALIESEKLYREGFMPEEDWEVCKEAYAAGILARLEASENKEELPVQSNSSADEIRKFKQLLDDGIITQEDFDAKKKQLLGL